MKSNIYGSFSPQQDLNVLKCLGSVSFVFRLILATRLTVKLAGRKKSVKYSQCDHLGTFLGPTDSVSDTFAWMRNGLLRNQKHLCRIWTWFNLHFLQLFPIVENFTVITSHPKPHLNFASISSYSQQVQDNFALSTSVVLSSDRQWLSRGIFLK